MLRQFGTNEFLVILAAAHWTVLLSLIAFADGANPRHERTRNFLGQILSH